MQASHRKEHARSGFDLTVRANANEITPVGHFNVARFNSCRPTFGCGADDHRCYGCSRRHSANVTIDVKFSATVTGRPTLVELTYLNDPAGHPVVVGQLRRNKCRDHDDGRDGEDHDRDRGCKNRDRYTLSKSFNFPAGQAQFQISATGSQGQVCRL